jgi:hypothetical protein
MAVFRFAKDSEDKKAFTPIEHRWAKRKPKRKGTGKAMRAKVVDKSNDQVLDKNKYYEGTRESTRPIQE